MKWFPFEYNNETYDLSHLHPFTLEIINDAKDGKDEQKYIFDVRFSLHCFTNACKESDDKKLQYSDNRETRSFCFTRYQLSLKLPEIVKVIHTKRCNHTGKGNFFIIESITEDGDLIEYEVYFDIKKSPRNNDPMKLFIQSAYVRTEESKKYRHQAKKINFFVIAHNKKHGKPIRVPR